MRADGRMGEGPVDGSTREGSLADATTADAATVDAATADATTADATSADSDAGPMLSPESCPVGDADGCCPLGLRSGGTDADCADLSCESQSLQLILKGFLVSALDLLDDSNVDE